MLPQWKWIKILFLLLNFCILIKEIEIFPLFLHAWSSSVLNFNTERNLRDYQVQPLHFRCQEIRSQKTELVPNGTANYSQRQSKSKQNPRPLTSFSVTVAWVYLFYPTHLFYHCLLEKTDTNGNMKVKASLALASSCRMEFIHRNFHNEQEFCKMVGSGFGKKKKTLLANLETEASFMIDLQGQE